MRDTFVETLTALAVQNPDICLLTADLGFGVLNPFREAVPGRFFNLGIAEQNMTSVAAGLALTGKRVVTYSIGNFPTLRCLEQIRNDCAYHGADVKIVCVGGGFTYGALGMSHHATEDLAVMRALPGVTVLSPGDRAETAGAVKAMLEMKGTCYLRLGRGGEPDIHKKPIDFRIGRAIEVHPGENVALFFTGPMYADVEKCAEILGRAGIHPAVYSFPTVKPLDEERILTCAERFSLIVTCEEHSKLGGFGSAVAEVLAEHPGRARLLRLGVPDCHSTVAGSQDYLRHQFRLDGESMAADILARL